MKEWLSQYGYLLIVFAVMLIVTLVIFYFAVRAYSNHNRTFRKHEEEMKRLISLKEKYLNFTPEILSENKDEELLEGVALSYQIRIQRQGASEKAFEEMNEEKKNIYVLDVFCCDNDVRIFFSQNGEIVKGRIIRALEMIGMEDFAHRLENISLMYDDSNEDVSYSEKAIDEMQDYITENGILSVIKLKSAEYIKNNYEVLKN